MQLINLLIDPPNKLSKALTLPGDNTEKIWAHQFLTKPNTIEAGGLRGALSPQGVQANALVNACMQILEQFCFFFLIQHAKML